MLCLRCWYMKTLIIGGVKLYIDPGFGSMIIQFVVATIAVLGGGLFVFKKKIKSFLSRDRK